MPEPELFGFGISVLANIAVAFGTILLAIFTYRSVKVSEKQMEFSRITIEKPRVLEKIQNVLNIIESELLAEREEISKHNLKWSHTNDRNSLYLAPLMFPLSGKKAFHMGIRTIFVGPEKGGKEIYSQLLHSIDINLKKRLQNYYSINGELYHLERKILMENSPERMAHLFSKLPKYTLKSNDSVNEEISVTYFDGTSTIVISQSDLNNIIVGMMIALIFEPSQSDERIFGYLGYQELIQDLYPHIVDSLKNQFIPDINWYIESIFGDLNELDDIDKSILDDVKSLKELYRDGYSLTENELAPFSGI